ncbi:hypothetical protein SKAU_G00159870 [Synaphobranchus kaupii]|uniref:Ion transport domain-containing protein n=1 Tax=Synaphobranchus kaupii TaxID=118154 RepID=A0A9Q1IZS3_SYNKA|nr:hypothetical protein SKAU_G00159870 [Synaphobranchus kaupii]
MLELIVRQQKLDLIMHPVVLTLIKLKWDLYGRIGAWILLLLNFLFIVSWTAVAISVSVIRDEKYPYEFPRVSEKTTAPLCVPQGLVLVVFLAVGFTVVQLYQEVAEVSRSRRKLRHWKHLCEKRINDDLSHAHPLWPKEQLYLDKQLEEIRNMKPSYFHNLWNVFDWLVYMLLMVVFGIHVTDIFIYKSVLRVYRLRLFAVTLIFLWLRLMKHVRGFRIMGPFIVMLGKIIGDVLRFSFLYIEIFIPYACAFWIIFGDNPEVPSMETIPKLMYSLYRLTLVDEYEFDKMVKVDRTMAYLLCGTFLALSALLCVNLMIALLSDTFQRVYDKALANAVMQQASITLLVEESMPNLCRFFAKETLEEFQEMRKEAHPLKPSKSGKRNRGARGKKSRTTAMDQNQLTEDLAALRTDMKKLQDLLHQLIQCGTGSRADSDAQKKDLTETRDSIL